MDHLSIDYWDRVSTVKQRDAAAPDYDFFGIPFGTPGFGIEEPVHTHPNTVLVLSAERQARMNLTNREIHRLMPRDRKIRFSVDVRSFLDADIPEEDILLLICDARKVAEVFTGQRLGITFVYTSTPGHEVFSIRCGRTLAKGILAQFFFPSDLPRDRQVLVSSSLMYSAYRFGNLSKIRRVLAHEFTHILGFRHWHAGSDDGEKEAPSKLWPGTTDDDRNTIMCTPYHSLLNFHEEDFRVIREVYSVRNGHMLDDCVVIDVDPYARRFIS
ncbi:hypothetical protein KVR01_004500 [Diaporthe batatas]|uniref:uncharacterized protein n=1 Tax=Diaporthe batatas TaxID=748121 RepID=UPI001D0432CC|nr:uncharacterized protein KVR01_004500 [Diaporthe batatas]KAG8165948.1 hypothetical protein KVR01_004500 [Diaporthe batatas]